MIRGFYSAKLGAIAQQEHMNVIANNMSNLNTVGFKDSRAAFADLMYQNINRNTAQNPAMIGHGVRLSQTGLDMTQGALQPTGYYLDYALTEEGTFFAVQDAAGDIYYTRAGNFILSSDGDTYYLAAGNGDRILDADFEQIEIEFERVENKVPVLDASGKPTTDANGDPIYNISYGEGAPILENSMIGVFKFANPYGLTQEGGNRFVATATSGEPTPVELPEIMSGYLEGSGVEVAEQMVKVIEASRAFSFNSRMVQVADEVEQTVNGLRG